MSSVSCAHNPRVMLRCEPEWPPQAMQELVTVHELGMDGTAHLYVDYYTQVDKLHAFCCTHASTAAQASWCE